jgi:hypothetical protein
MLVESQYWGRGFMNITNLLSQIQSEFDQLQRNHTKSVEKNNDLFRVLATVKNDLEKTLKNPDTLKNTVCACIDLLRANTPYYSATEGVNKIDPPLTDEQKVL